MLSEERKALILEYINENKAVSATELMKKFNASEATIRRDLTEMDKKGLISKVHGGAVSLQSQIVSDFNISDREEKNRDEKIAIAKYAASLISNNDLVFLDAGTTTSYVIDFVEAQNVSFVTNAIGHAQKIATKGYPVYLVGGRLKPITEAVVGGDAYEFIMKYNFSIGFFGTNAVSKENGFMTPDPEEAKIKECAIKCTLSPYVLCDHAKFDLTSPVRFASYDKACIITTGDIPKAYRKEKSIIYV